VSDTSWWSRRRQLVVGGLAVAALVLFWYGRRPVTAVQVTAVRRAGMLVEVTTNGKVEPIDDIEVRARLDGRVLEVVDPGTKVAAGDVVLRLDQSDAAAALATAQSDRLAAQDSLRSARDAAALAKERAAVDARLEHAGALTRERLAETTAAAADTAAKLAFLEHDVPLRVAALDLRIQDLTAQTEAASLRATIAGTVYRTDVKKGAMVHVGDPLVAMADLDHLRVRANIDQVDLGRVQPGQEERITSNAFPGRSWKGHVTDVTPHVIVRDNRSISESLAQIDPPTTGLVPGMTVDVQIVISDAGDVLQVGADTIVGDQRQPFVFRLDGSRIRRTPIRIGRTNATDAEVLEGLDAKDRVVVSPRPELQDGMQVDATTSGT